MERSTPMRRDTPKSKAWANKARKPLRARSVKQADDSVRQASVRAEVFARDGNRCVVEQFKGTRQSVTIGNRSRSPVLTLPDITLPACRGQLTFGHRRHAGAGGAYVTANGACVCEGCNEHCANNADDMRAIFGTRLIVREGDPEWDELGRKANGVR